MKLADQREIHAPREAVWAGITDPDTLRRCISGCQEMTGSVEDGFEAVVVQKVGPVKATFRGHVALDDVVEGESATLRGEGKGGPAGFAKGEARVVLTEIAVGTRLDYEVEAKVGGKLAQLGGRVIDGVAGRLADGFFDRFKEVVEEPGAEADGAEADGAEADGAEADGATAAATGTAPATAGVSAEPAGAALAGSAEPTAHGQAAHGQAAHGQAAQGQAAREQAARGPSGAEPAGAERGGAGPIGGGPSEAGPTGAAQSGAARSGAAQSGAAQTGAEPERKSWLKRLVSRDKPAQS